MLNSESAFVATCKLSVVGKGQTVEGPDLKIHDSVKLFLVRYIAYSEKTNKSKIYGIYPPDKEPLCFPPMEGMPDLSGFGYSYRRAPLREGFVYVYRQIKNKSEGIYQELEVSQEGYYTNLRWEDPKAREMEGRSFSMTSWDFPIHESCGDFIHLSKGRDVKIWVAFSCFRWSKKYALSVFNDEKKRNERMQVIDCEKCFGGIFEQGSFASEEQSMMVYDPCIPLAEYLAGEPDYNQWQHPMIQAYYDRMCDRYEATRILMEEEKDRGDFYFTINDVLGVADNICDDLGIEHKWHQAMIDSLREGRAVEEVFSQKEKQEICDDPNALERSAMIDLAALFYQMKNTPTIPFREYIDLLKPDLLEQTLAIPERREQREKINKLRWALSKILICENYQQIMVDFNVEDIESLLNGKRCLSYHVNSMQFDPHYSDYYLDGVGKVQKTQTFLKIIDQLADEQTNTGKLLQREWDVETAADSAALIHQLAIAIDDVFLSFSELLKNNEKVISKLFKISTGRNGQCIVKIPKNEIPERLLKRIDYTRAKPSTIRNVGRSITINFDDLAEFSTRSLNGREFNIPINVALPNWLALYKDKTAQWRKNIDNLLIHPCFLRCMIGISGINLAFAIREEKEKNGLRNAVNITACSLEFMYIGWRYAEVSIAVENMPSRLAKVFSKQISKGRIGGLAIILGTISMAMDIADCFENDEKLAGSFLVVSVTSGMLAYISGFSSLSYLLPYVIPFVLLGLLTGLIGAYIKLSGTENLLKYSVFGKKHSFKIDSKNTGLMQQQLLLTAHSASAQLDERFKDYLANQQLTLNNFIYLHRGVISASSILYYHREVKSIGLSHSSHTSTGLHHADITCKLDYLPFIRGKIELDFGYVSSLDSTSFEKEQFDMIGDVELNIETKVISMSFSSEGSFSKSGGFFVLVFRSYYDDVNGQKVYAPALINGKDNYFACYISADRFSVDIPKNTNAVPVERIYSSSINSEGYLYVQRGTQHIEIVQVEKNNKSIHLIHYGKEEKE